MSTENAGKRLAPFKGQRFDTLAVHGGQHADPVTGALMPAIYQTSTYAQTEPAKPIGVDDYSRAGNPTRRMLEDCVALLEGGDYGFVTASGMSAIHLITGLLKSGEEIIACDDVYGGTFRLLTRVLVDQGIKSKYLNLSIDNPGAALEAAGSAQTKMVWIESPTNPLLKLIDIETIAKVCKKKGWLLVVDNTFASPVFQKPLALGADIVMHSLTKYMNGHSDVVLGALVVKDLKVAEKLQFLQLSTGHIAGPFDSWLVLRGLKTLAIRMRAHEQGAMRLAKWLEKHPKVSKVLYPGLESHPQHALAKKQMSGFGGMLSFYLKGGLKEAKALLQNVKVFTLAESLGGVESLIEHPALMTHASLPPEVREQNGISDGFIRLSVGIEDVKDLEEDLANALAHV